MPETNKKQQQQVFYPWSGFLCCLALSMAILAAAGHFYGSGLAASGGVVISAADLGSSKLEILSPFAMVLLRVGTYTALIIIRSDE